MHSERHQVMWQPRHQAKPQTWVHLAPSVVSKRQTWNSPAYAHAIQELQQLAADLIAVAEPQPSPEARFCMLDVLRDVLATDSVYPALSGDGEGGLIAEWRADNKIIEIHTADDGETDFRVRLRRGATLYEGSSTVQLRRHLRDMTAFVNSVNPAWRSLFGQGAVPRPA